MWGCSANDAATLAPADRASGQIHLPLVTPDDGAFRLRQASFTIDDSAGNLVLTLDSDADPDATSLDAELGQAAYSIELLDGWSLEQLAEDGSSTAVAAALLTTNPTDFEIHDGGVTNILYQFATNSGVVSFGAGTLDIGVDVTTQAGLPGCDLLDRNSCPSGQSCLLRDGSGETFCADSGSLPIGSPCSSDQCVAGSQCLAIEGSTERVCTRFCNPASTFCGCRSLSTDENVGVCDPSLPITPARFQHDFSDGSSGFGSLACEEWSAFRDTLNGGVFGRVVIESSTGNSIECNEPALADQICGALGARSSTQVFCEGHTWNVGICEDSEITVDSSICNCTFSPTVRPCDDSYGGFGTFTCSNVPQVLAVLCE
ncbi:MAG TPA: hypothetical protein VMG12_20330 [Polyangiaceae bacterium]|nr:hypothetical protein [Polyangiaceae bacterium]